MSNLPPDLAGRLAIVTGAGRGIGRGIVDRLAAAGARVIAADRDSDALEKPFATGEVETLVLDFASDPAVLAKTVHGRFGAPELIVNNVGIATPHRFLELQEADFDLVFATNLRGPWFFTKLLVERLVESRSRGSIVFISSLHDRRVRRYPHYSASKAGVSMLVRELAQELGPCGIRVNAVSPGWVPHDHDEPGSRVTGRIALGRPGTPGDIASIVAVLLSDEVAGYVTGVNVPVDGGLDLYNWLME
jgi:NAD(P)-dependent dehydrogenase (short-subunit alcohol dehydrogenase family)